MGIIVAVIQFPGSNCEYEAARAARAAGMGADVYRWNRNPRDLRRYDGYIIPGGFSYQDRNRSGVVAAKDPVMDVVAEQAENGKQVMGICNGFQILCESGLLPGVVDRRIQAGLAPNKAVRDGETVRTGFYCDWVYIRHEVPGNTCAETRLFEEGDVIPIPIAHGEGRFTCSDDMLRQLEENGQIVWRYCDSQGNVTEEANPNGAMSNIAGVCNVKRNVLGMMPHPERDSSLYQMPESMWPEKREAYGNAEAMRGPGPGLKVFNSMRTFIEDSL